MAVVIGIISRCNLRIMYHRNQPNKTKLALYKLLLMIIYNSCTQITRVCISVIKVGVGLSLLCWHNIENNRLQICENNAGIIGCSQAY